MMWPADRTDSEGANTVFYCLTNGRRPFRVTWSRRDGQPLPEYSVVESRRLLIQRVTKKDEGVYQCTVRNSYGIDTAVGMLHVLG